MKSFAIAFAVLASVSSFAASVDLSTSTFGHKLVDAEYKLVATKTEVRDIPGCNPNSDAGYPCTEVVVLESKPVVAVNVSYEDRMFTQEGNQKEWLTLNFEVSEFDAADVAALKTVYPTWKHPFSRTGARFAKNHFALSVQKVARTIQVVDVRNSHLCRIGESGEPDAGCVEHIVYKPATTFVKEVTVSKK